MRGRRGGRRRRRRRQLRDAIVDAIFDALGGDDSERRANTHRSGGPDVLAVSYFELECGAHASDPVDRRGGAERDSSCDAVVNGRAHAVVNR